MSKNFDESKSKMRFKSTRKPLRVVSNAKATNKSSVHKKNSENDGGDASLDRLLLVHSDFSSLIRQIDELVIRALQVTSNNGRKEIKQFADVLSNTQTSLKPWVSRFEKALLCQSTGQENQSKQPMKKETLAVSKQSTDTVVESPETKWESQSLVSPSPLVSWRAGCHTERGRQLFLLTPLPQKQCFSSKYKAPLGTLEKDPSDETGYPSLNLGNDVQVGESAKPTPKMDLDIEATKAVVGNLQTDCASPEKVSNANCSLFIMTPCMKMSPPKSCILLEPISTFSKNKSRLVYRSTPFPTGVTFQDSESSSGESSDNLKLKYPELKGINMENMQKKMVAEDSPYWNVSPPKTCAIMDPSDNCLPFKTTTVSNKEDDFSSAAIKTNEVARDSKEMQDITRTVDFAEFTPMSSFPTGKHPGENTLKKELWTRFEAASTTTHDIRFNTSITKKGFLDILDEASDA